MSIERADVRNLQTNRQQNTKGGNSFINEEQQGKLPPLWASNVLTSGIYRKLTMIAKRDMYKGQEIEKRVDIATKSKPDLVFI